MQHDITLEQGGKMMEFGEYQHVEGSIMLAGYCALIRPINAIVVIIILHYILYSLWWLIVGSPSDNWFTMGS